MPKNSNKATKIELCRVLNKIGALQFGAFKLTSGKFSPYYIDLRVVPSFPDVFQRVCDSYRDLVNDEIGRKNFDRIVGIPVTGLPFASLAAYEFKKPFLYIRKGVRLHGRQRRIEGIIAPGDRVLLIDDLVTSGLSLKRAARSVRAEGGVVKDAAVLIDRKEGGEERLLEDGIKLHALLDIGEIANRLFELQAIDEQQMKTILKQTKKK